MGRGPVIGQGSKTLGDKQTAFDAELTAVEAALLWYQDTDHPHLIIHSDSQSAIARSKHCGAGPRQRMARSIQKILADILGQGRSANIVWVKGHICIPGNEKADRLAGQAAGKVAWSQTASLSHLKLRVSERYREAKKKWHENPKNHGKDEIPPPAPKTVLHGSRPQLHCPGRSTDKDWALEVGDLPEKDQETDRQRLLVLQGRSRHDQVSRLATLLECENERCQNGSLGRKGPRRIACPTGQPQVGKETVGISRALRGRQSCGQRGR
jgi:ribonuclease HI